MPLERRNEPQMLRQFSRIYPSFNLNPLLRRRHQQLVEAQAFNEWLSQRRLRQEGESYADEIGRMTEAVNRRIPQFGPGPCAGALELPLKSKRECMEYRPRYVAKSNVFKEYKI